MFSGCCRSRHSHFSCYFIFGNNSWENSQLRPFFTSSFLFFTFHISFHGSVECWIGFAFSCKYDKILYQTFELYYLWIKWEKSITIFKTERVDSNSAHSTNILFFDYLKCYILKWYDSLEMKRLMFSGIKTAHLYLNWI